MSAVKFANDVRPVVALESPDGKMAARYLLKMVHENDVYRGAAERT
jgi:hypothetical protein